MGVLSLPKTPFAYARAHSRWWSDASRGRDDLTETRRPLGSTRWQSARPHAQPENNLWWGVVAVQAATGSYR